MRVERKLMAFETSSISLRYWYSLVCMETCSCRSCCGYWSCAQYWTLTSYDFRQIHYRTGKFPLNYEDSQLKAKCILNHVETHKAKVGLKQLAGANYGDWGISADNFDVSQMYQPHVLKYAATDACATYWLWNSINTYIQEQSCQTNVT